jgi:hypothetical protein
VTDPDLSIAGGYRDLSPFWVEAWSWPRHGWYGLCASADLWQARRWAAGYAEALPFTAFRVLDQRGCEHGRFTTGQAP